MAMICLQTMSGNDRPDRLVLQTDGPEETEQLALLLAGILMPGSVLSLNGDLGAGKTAFTRGLARGLACHGQVASPTFTLLMEHPPCPGGLALFHFDVYRLDPAGAAEAFLDLGLDEYFDAGGVCVIEWGDKIATLLPDRTVHVHFSQPGEADLQRLVEICWSNGADQLKRLAERINAWRSGHSSC